MRGKRNWSLNTFFKPPIKVKELRGLNPAPFIKPKITKPKSGDFTMKFELLSEALPQLDFNGKSLTKIPGVIRFTDGEFCGEYGFLYVCQGIEKGNFLFFKGVSNSDIENIKNEKVKDIFLKCKEFENCMDVHKVLMGVAAYYDMIFKADVLNDEVLLEYNRLLINGKSTVGYYNHGSYPTL
jgi:hypothetical protein